MTLILDGERKCAVEGCGNLGKPKENVFRKRQGVWMVRRATVCSKHYMERRSGKALSVKRKEGEIKDLRISCPHCHGKIVLRKLIEQEKEL